MPSRLVLVLSFCALSAICFVAHGADPLNSEDTLQRGVRENGLAAPGDSCFEATPSRLMDLPALLDLALCTNPQIRQSWQLAKKQSAAVGEADGAYWPRLNLSYSRSRGTMDTAIDDSRYPDYSVDTQPQRSSLVFSWVVYDFGRREAESAASHRALDMMVQRYRETASQVVHSVARSYYDFARSRKILDTTTQALRDASLSYEASNGKYQAGAGSRADVLQAKANLERFRYLKLAARQSVLNAKAELTYAVGLNAAVDIDVDPGSLSIPDQMHLGLLSELMKTAESNHPALRSARSSVHEAQARVDAARSSGLPVLSLVGNVDYSDSLTSGSNYTYSTRSNSLGLSLTVPIFDGFVTTYRVRQANAELDARKAVLVETENSVSYSVLRSFNNMQSAMARISAAQSTVESARMASEIAYGRYRSGVGSLIELLDAQRLLAQSKEETFIAVSEWGLSGVELALAIGQLDTGSYRKENYAY